MIGDDDIVSRLDDCVADQLDDFVGAVAQNHVFASQTESLGNRVAQFPATAIWVNMYVFHRFLHCGNSHWRRANRVFVGGEFDDFVRLKAEFAGNGFNWLPGLVSHEIAELWIGVIPNGHGISDLRFSDFGFPVPTFGEIWALKTENFVLRFSRQKLFLPPAESAPDEVAHDRPQRNVECPNEDENPDGPKKPTLAIPEF